MMTNAVEAMANLMLENMEVVDAEAIITTIKVSGSMTIDKVAAWNMVEETSMVVDKVAATMSLLVIKDAERTTKDMEALEIMRRTLDMIVKTRDMVILATRVVMETNVVMNHVLKATVEEASTVVAQEAMQEGLPPTSIKMRYCATASNMVNLVIQTSSRPLSVFWAKTSTVHNRRMWTRVACNKATSNCTSKEVVDNNTMRQVWVQGQPCRL